MKFLRHKIRVGTTGNLPLNVLAIFLLVFQVPLFTSCKDEGCKNPLASNYDAGADVDDPCACRYDGVASCAQFNPPSLSITPVRQETEVWCWLAVGEMIFRYYQLPNVNPGGDYQCGIVGAVGYALDGACSACNINCGNCVRPAGNSDMITTMLTAYPKVACKELYQSNKTLKPQFVANYLAASFLISELDNKRPVIAGINPGSQFILPGNSQHVALITGYHYTAGNLILHVNDPYPYYVTGFDPYVFYGAINNGNLSYQVAYTTLVSGLKWNTSWYSIGW